MAHLTQSGNIWNPSMNPIVKLLGAENYHNWSALMRTHLKRKKLYEDKDLQALEKKIFFAVSPTVLGSIENLTNAKDAWTTLKRLYAASCKNRLIPLLTIMVSAKLDNFNHVEDCINQITHTAADLQLLAKSAIRYLWQFSWRVNRIVANH